MCLYADDLVMCIKSEKISGLTKNKIYKVFSSIGVAFGPDRLKIYGSATEYPQFWFIKIKRR